MSEEPIIVHIRQIIELPMQYEMSDFELWFCGMEEQE